MTRLSKKCRSGCKYKIQTGEDDSALVSRWRKTVEIAGDPLNKIWCVIYPSGYPDDMFEILHNKLLAVK